MKIRSANLKDAEDISQLISHLAKKYICVDCTPEGASKLLSAMDSSSIKAFIEVPSDSEFQYLLAEVKNKIVGVIGVKNSFHLYHLFVAEEFHNKGVASALLKAFLQLKPQQSITLRVNSSPYALPFYQKLGFKSESSTVWRNGISSIPMSLRVNQIANSNDFRKSRKEL